VELGAIDPKFASSAEGIGKSTVQKATESINELRPYGRDRLEILDYLDNQLSLNIQRNPQNTVQEQTMTPKISVKDKETRYMIVNSQIQKDDNKEIIQRKIKLILVNHDHK
jgi:hypothetical protein